MNIGIYCGYWSTNIGNSFFQLGAEYILQKAFPKATIFFIADEQGYINPAGGNPKNSFCPIDRQSLDYAVILGPFIRPEVGKIVVPTLQKLKKQGVKILAMGIGMMDYTKKTILYSAEILKEIQPDLFLTRDRETYDAFSKYVKNSYDGIDLGFFSSDVYSGTGIQGDYITLNFDQLPEPKIEEGYSDVLPFELNKKQMHLKFNPYRKKWNEKGFIYQMIDRLFFPKFWNKDVADWEIIRTDHRYNPVFLRRIYSHPNTISSDVPFPYWAVYKNSKLTISNRVHACVATLSFGNPAWLFSKSPRSYLLDRVGANTIKAQPTRIDLQRLAEEKKNLIEYVQTHII